jgi:hypothetical protein
MLLEQLQKLSEPIFTKEVVIPLLAKILNGRVEYTHSATEAGRDLVIFAQDQFGYDKIYCAQVKVTPISYGAAAFGAIVNTLKTAKREGVTLSTGSRLSS